MRAVPTRGGLLLQPRPLHRPDGRPRRLQHEHGLGGSQQRPAVRLLRQLGPVRRGCRQRRRSAAPARCSTHIRPTRPRWFWARICSSAERLICRDQNSDRSDIEIDGIPAYAAATAENLLSGSANYAGLPAVSSTSSLDPTTGDLVIHESEPLVKCEAEPHRVSGDHIELHRASPRPGSSFNLHDRPVRGRPPGSDLRHLRQHRRLLARAGHSLWAGHAEFQRWAQLPVGRRLHVRQHAQRRRHHPGSPHHAGHDVRQLEQLARRRSRELQPRARPPSAARAQRHRVRLQRLLWPAALLRVLLAHSPGRRNGQHHHHLLLVGVHDRRRAGAGRGRDLAASRVRSTGCDNGLGVVDHQQQRHRVGPGESPTARRRITTSSTARRPLTVTRRPTSTPAAAAGPAWCRLTCDRANPGHRVLLPPGRQQLVGRQQRFAGHLLHHRARHGDHRCRRPRSPTRARRSPDRSTPTAWTPPTTSSTVHHPELRRLLQPLPTTAAAPAAGPCRPTWSASPQAPSTTTAWSPAARPVVPTVCRGPSGRPSRRRRARGDGAGRHQHHGHDRRFGQPPTASTRATTSSTAPRPATAPPHTATDDAAAAPPPIR